MRKEKKSWDYQPPQQIFLNENLKEDKLYNFKDIVDLVKNNYPDIPGTAIDSYLKNLEKLGEVLKIITNEGPRFRSTKNLEIVEGIVQWQPKGHALVIMYDEKGHKKEENIFLTKKESARVLNGEKVKVKKIPALWKSINGEVGEDEGIIIDVLESKPCHIIAENIGVNKTDWVGGVKPLEMMFNNNIFRISERHETRFSEDRQQKVKEKGIILSGQLRRSGTFDRFSELYAFFDVKNILGHWEDYGIETKIALDWMQAEERFFSNVLAEAHRVSSISLEDLMKDEGRKDLRKVPFVTIDGATTKDFDDAVCAKKTKNGWLVHVAIADVSRYVTPDSLLDEVAKKRTSTLYMPHKAIPMLPEILSNGVCSLNPGLDRAAMVCEIEISQSGEISESKFYPAIINSHARLLYDEVDLYSFTNLDNLNIKGLLPIKNIENQNINLDNFSYKISNVVKDLLECASVLRKNRNQPEFDRIPEIIPILGENGKADSLKIMDEMTPANKLIEEFMLLTNYKAAEFLYKNKDNHVLFRNQKPPAEGKTLLKSAKYEVNSYGHYGIGKEHYLHFTSPIRRYPDLIAHRAIKNILGYSDEVIPDLKSVIKLGEDCTEIQRLSKGASNKARQWLVLEYASRNKGNVELATILKELDTGWIVYGNETKISGFVKKPSSVEEQENMKNSGIVIEIDRIDMFGERVSLNLKNLDYLIVKEEDISVKKNKI